MYFLTYSITLNNSYYMNVGVIYLKSLIKTKYASIF